MPDTTWYRPVSWEELVSACREVDKSDLQEGEVPWTQYKNFAIASIQSEIDKWYRESLKAARFTQIEGSREHGQFLEHIRGLMLGLSEYSDTFAVLSWAAAEEKEISRLETGNKLINRLFGRNTKSKIKREALEKYDKTWGYKTRFRNLENFLLKEYQRYSLATLENLISVLSSKDKVVNRKASLKPIFRPIYTPIEFEHYCSEWMTYLGFKGVNVSKASGDGGVDIFAIGAVAQVKFYNTPIGVGPVRELLGASLDFRAQPIFFSSMSYTQAAVDFADRNNIALFLVDIFTSEIKPASVEAQKMI